MVSGRPSTPSAKSEAANTDKRHNSVNLQPPPVPAARSSSQSRNSSGFGFLRRSKSGEQHNEKARRSISGSRLLKKNHKEMLAEQERQRLAEQNAIPKVPPILPGLYDNGERRVAPLPTFGGENAKPSSGGHPVIGNRTSSRGGTVPGGDITNRTAPPIPASVPFDPYARSESMTHRGRYSYASSAVSSINSPRRVRRRKDPTPFNVLVIGAKNSGKTSFLEFLRQSLAHKKRHGMMGVDHSHHNGQSPIPGATSALGSANPSFASQYLETEIDGERIGLTLWDSEGLEKNVVDLQLRELINFLESKFEETFTEEQKVIRATGIQDTHIHCVFLLLDPIRLSKSSTASHKGQQTNGHRPEKGGLDPSDLQVLRSLQGKTAVIPIIGKADTITAAHMAVLKRTVWDGLKGARLDPMEAFGLDDEFTSSNRLDEEDETEDGESVTDGDERGTGITGKVLSDTSEDDSGSDYSATDPVFGPSGKQNRATSGKSRNSASTVTGKRHVSEASERSEREEELPYLPMSVISPDMYEPGVVGRKFPWGFADPFNAAHCDFVKLKEMIFSEWRQELRVASRERWYEDWRTSRLNGRGI